MRTYPPGFWNLRMVYLRVAMAIFGTKVTPLYESYRREKPWRDEQDRRRESLASQREWEQLQAARDHVMRVDGTSLCVHQWCQVDRKTGSVPTSATMMRDWGLRCLRCGMER